MKTVPVSGTLQDQHRVEHGAHVESLNKGDCQSVGREVENFHPAFVTPVMIGLHCALVITNRTAAMSPAEPPVFVALTAMTILDNVYWNSVKYV